MPLLGEGLFLLEGHAQMPLSGLYQFCIASVPALQLYAMSSPFSFPTRCRAFLSCTKTSRRGVVHETWA